MPSVRHAVGLRTVSILEALKGILVLLLGFGALALIHKDLEEIAERLIDFLRVNPDSRVSGFFFALADRTTDRSLLILALGATTYAVARFVEAYGLWNERAWAEWFALVSGAIYLPWEVRALMHHPHWWKWAVLLINILVVLYMVRLRMRAAGLQREQV